MAECSQCTIARNDLWEVIRIRLAHLLGLRQRLQQMVGHRDRCQGFVAMPELLSYWNACHDASGGGFVLCGTSTMSLQTWCQRRSLRGAGMRAAADSSLVRPELERLMAQAPLGVGAATNLDGVVIVRPALRPFFRTPRKTWEARLACTRCGRSCWTAWWVRPASFQARRFPSAERGRLSASVITVGVPNAIRTFGSRSSTAPVALR